MFNTSNESSQRRDDNGDERDKKYKTWNRTKCEKEKNLLANRLRVLKLGLKYSNKFSMRDELHFPFNDD